MCMRTARRGGTTHVCVHHCLTTIAIAAKRSENKRVRKNMAGKADEKNPNKSTNSLLDNAARVSSSSSAITYASSCGSASPARHRDDGLARMPARLMLPMPARTMRAVALALGAEEARADAVELDVKLVDFEAGAGAEPPVLGRDAPAEWLRSVRLVPAPVLPLAPVCVEVAVAAAVASLTSFEWRTCAESCMLNEAAFFTARRGRVDTRHGKILK